MITQGKDGVLIFTRAPDGGVKYVRRYWLAALVAQVTTSSLSVPRSTLRIRRVMSCLKLTAL